MEAGRERRRRMDKLAIGRWGPRVSGDLCEDTVDRGYRWRLICAHICMTCILVHFDTVIGLIIQLYLLKRANSASGCSFAPS